MDPKAGQIVRFFPRHERWRYSASVLLGDPQPAIVAYVLPTGRVNLTVLTVQGGTLGELNVRFRHEGQSSPAGEDYCDIEAELGSPTDLRLLADLRVISPTTAERPALFAADLETEAEYTEEHLRNQRTPATTRQFASGFDTRILPASDPLPPVGFRTIGQPVGLDGNPFRITPDTVAPPPQPFVRGGS